MEVPQDIKIRTEREDTLLTVHLEGHMDRITSPELEKQLTDEALDNVTKVVFDLDKVTYVSSAGLRVILRVDKALGDRGKVSVINVNPFIMEVFEICDFTELMDIRPKQPAE